MITDDQRAMLNEAKALERRRVEITEKAINQRVADLLPTAWGSLIHFEDINSRPVEISFLCGLCPDDAQTFTDRECRDFISFVADLAQEARLNQLNEEHEEDEE